MRKTDTIKWAVESVKCPLNKLYGWNFKVYEDDGVKFPVCVLLSSSSEIQSKLLLDKQQEYAQLIASAPELLDACRLAMCYLQHEEPAYEILERAIEKATNYGK